MSSLLLVSPVFADFTPEFVLSMLETFRVARARGWRVDEPELLYVQGSMLVDARNTLAADVLEHTTAEWIVWADADMRWRGMDVAHMIESGADVTGVCAPTQDGGFVDTGPLTEEGSFADAPAIGFGVVVMRRSVLQRFANEGIPMFREVAATATSRHIGEDVCFSRDWRAFGGRLQIYLDAEVGHIGRTLFVGNYGRRQLEAVRQDRRR